MLCPTCNTPNRVDARFCKKCGHPFQQTEADHPEAQSDQPTVIAVPTTPAAPTSVAQVNTGAGTANEVEDVSFAPTQILTHEQMQEIQNRRLQREAEQGQSAPQMANGDAPTMQSANTQGGANANEQMDIADMPTMLITPQQQQQSSYETAEPIAPPPPPTPPSPNTNDEPAPIPPPPPGVTAPPDATDAGMVQVYAGASISEPANAEADQPTVKADATNESADATKEGEENVPETTQTTGTGETAGKDGTEETDQPAGQSGEGNTTGQPNTGGDFAVLAVGTVVAGRYEIAGVVSDDSAEHVYQVVDHQGYQHCWNCGSEENHEGDEFCNDCGAELLNMAYVLHEYPASGGGGEASVLQGNIVNTFVDQGKTYAVEQEQTAQSPFPNGVRLSVATDSDAGDVRRSDPNEDSTLALLLQRVHESISTPMGVFIVADGLGGHDNGQLASRVAINIIAERMVRELLNAPLTAEKAAGKGQSPQPADEEMLVELLKGAIEDANVAICQMNQHEKTDMGSTITGFMIVGEHAYILNVGDSRTYMVRGGQIYQLTNDHSLVGQLVAGGLIQPDDVYTHPQRSQIFRSLGDKMNVQVDIFKQDLHPGDILLACCDGLWEMIRNPQIESILNTAQGPQAAASQLIETANANGGEDNISAVVVYVS